MSISGINFLSNNFRKLLWRPQNFYKAISGVRDHYWTYSSPIINMGRSIYIDLPTSDAWRAARGATNTAWCGLLCLVYPQPSPRLCRYNFKQNLNNKKVYRIFWNSDLKWPLFGQELVPSMSEIAHNTWSDKCRKLSAKSSLKIKYLFFYETVYFRKI